VRVTVPPRVLLLDDYWSQRESLEETVADFEPDLVLVDILRSTFDGVEVVRRVKATGSTAGVIIITRECSLETLKAVFPTGEVEYLIAPFPQPALAVAANQALSRRDIARQDQGAG
jgi:two-component system OmpR family response regulator